MSSTISPNGQYLAALGWNDFSGYLTIVDLKTETIVSADRAQHAVRASAQDDSTVAADGPLFSPDGSTLWVPQSDLLRKFSFDPTTGAATQEASICAVRLRRPQLHV